MTFHFLKTALLLTLMFTLPIIVIRAQPYIDPVIPALIQADCPTPCFMGIRPGVTSMRESAEILDVHAWVANGQADFPKELRDAPFFDAVLRKTVIYWRWSDRLPDWIIGDYRGGMTIQDARVLDMGIATRFTMGEVFLAFGSPTKVYFSASKDGLRFQYTVWYAEQGIVVITQGACPVVRAFDYPVQVVFVSNDPQISEDSARNSVCG